RLRLRRRRGPVVPVLQGSAPHLRSQGRSPALLPRRCLRARQTGFDSRRALPQRRYRRRRQRQRFSRL
ncbi:hypothetical protein IWW55_005067, partial [Coemansia sp. RSA 2706]